MNIDIAIDAFRLIAEPRTSGAFYVAELTKALNDQDGIGIITLLLPRPVDKNFLFSNLLALERVRVIQPSAPCFPERSFCSNLWWIQGVIPKLLKKQPPDWFIAPYHQTPLRLNRKTLVITLIMDVCGLSPFAGYYWYKKGPYRHLINFMTALLRADVFVYISYHTKQSFEHIFPFAKWRKSAVINCGLTLQTLSPVETTTHLEAIDLHYKKFYVGFGALGKRKGFDIILAGFRMYREKGGQARLVLITAKSVVPEIMGLVGDMDGSVQIVSDLSNPARDAVYRGALALLFPSRCEGFGYPILEAMAQGCPPIAWELTPAAEIVGHSFSLMATLDPTSLASAMFDVESMGFVERESLAQELIQRSRLFAGSTIGQEFTQLMLKSGHCK